MAANNLQTMNEASDEDMSVEEDHLSQAVSSSEGDTILAGKESRQVSASRLVMMTCLLVAASVVGICTWIFVSSSEKESFQESFEGLSYELIQVSQINANNKFRALETLSLSMTTMGLSSNATWPFVTHPNFEAEAGHIRELLQALWVAWIPLVYEKDRLRWEDYSVKNQWWIRESFVFREELTDDLEFTPINEFIFRRHFSNGSEYRDNIPFDEEFPYYLPAWQTSKVLPDAPNINLNIMSDPFMKKVFKEMTRVNEAVLSEAFDYSLYIEAGKLPESYLVQPIYDDFGPSGKLVAFVAAFVPWNYFENILSPDNANGIYVILKNPCGSTFTFLVNGPAVTFLGAGDWHDTDYDYMEIAINATGIKTPADCRYTMHLYPSTQFEDEHRTSQPIIFTAAGILIFFVTAVVFFVYDCFVKKRQDRVMETATRSGALVNSLYPPTIRDRLMKDAALKPSAKGNGAAFISNPIFGHSKTSVKHARDLNNANSADLTEAQKIRDLTNKGEESAPIVLPTKPIADYYPQGTIMIADLVGFAAWSSVREPAQVFTLLETLYNSFDRIAKKSGVFKVETLGDCYVAAGGIPEPMANHAQVMALFARDCKKKMREVVRQLEIWLGPDTADLSMRLALHSGPVTAGVLRGEKSRFQLFGETVDNAFILESQGSRNKIHVSQATADLLIGVGKGYWLVPRTNKMQMKGMKGKVDVQTYWLEIKTRQKTAKTDQTDVTSNVSSSQQQVTTLVPGAGAKTRKINTDQRRVRLVEWSTDVLTRLLKMVIAVREKADDEEDSKTPFHTNLTNPLDEVQEIIKLRTDMTSFQTDPNQMVLPDMVEKQLHNYVAVISDLYQDNSFHNFEHACHVTQAVTKLISRVVTPEEIDTNTMCYKKKAAADELHQYTYGITSDPLIQFSCALSALIHDVDHPGVPNSQLVKEGTPTAGTYGNKSVAEQNSVDLAWNVLMEPEYDELRRCIYTDNDELNRFRQLVVNSVMATDIVDKELGAKRKARWNKAFSEEDDVVESDEDKVNRKATIVIEHVVQAADVSHMMQHWHIYLKWNERFFRECYKAYMDGRSETDPSLGWYKGELGFFDFYIIPLAKKLKDCGVFGVSSDEFLNYAVANRNGWESKGQSVVAGYLRNFEISNNANSSSDGSQDEGVVDDEDDAE